MADGDAKPRRLLCPQFVGVLGSRNAQAAVPAAARRDFRRRNGDWRPPVGQIVGCEVPHGPAVTVREPGARGGMFRPGGASRDIRRLIRHMTRSPPFLFHRIASRRASERDAERHRIAEDVPLRLLAYDLLSGDGAVVHRGRTRNGKPLFRPEGLVSWKQRSHAQRRLYPGPR